MPRRSDKEVREEREEIMEMILLMDGRFSVGDVKRAFWLTRGVKRPSIRPQNELSRVDKVVRRCIDWLLAEKRVKFLGTEKGWSAIEQNIYKVVKR